MWIINDRYRITNLEGRMGNVENDANANRENIHELAHSNVVHAGTINKLREEVKDIKDRLESLEKEHQNNEKPCVECFVDSVERLWNGIVSFCHKLKYN